MGLGEAGVEADRLPIRRDRPFDLVEIDATVAELVMESACPGVEPDGLLELRGSRGIPGLMVEHDAEVGMRLRVSRLQADRLAALDLGTRVILEQVAQDRAQLEMGPDKAGVQPDRLAEDGGRFGPPTLVPQGDPEIAAGPGASGLQADRLAEFGLGPGVVAHHIAEGLSERHVSVDVARRMPRRRSEMCQSLVSPAELKQCVTEVDLGDGVTRLEPNGLAERLARLGPAALTPQDETEVVVGPAESRHEPDRFS